MRLVCPECGATGSAAMFAADGEARECMRLIAEAPGGLGPALLGYLALFRPGPPRALAWPRARRLLEELLAMIASPAVARSRREIAATPEEWRQALEQIAAQRQRLTLPLKSHGYLLEILSGIVARAEKPAANAARASADGPQPAAVSLDALYAESRRRSDAQLARAERERAK